MKRIDVLEAIRDCEEWYGALITTNHVTRREVMRCVRAGLVKSVGMVVVIGEDESPREPERYREGFRLTDAARILLRRYNR